MSVKKGKNMNKTIGFIGCGNMGAALARAVAKTVAGTDILLADLDAAKTEALASELGARVSTAEEIASTAYAVVLGVKPQALEKTLAPLKATLAAREDTFFFVSMAAGTSIDKIAAYAGASYPTVRIMPNLPAAIGEGMILYTAKNTCPTCEQFFLSAFDRAGTLDEIPEGMMDAAAALSGCGPAFVALFAEALADGAVACGVPRAKAQLYAEKTILGTAAYLLETGMHPATLKDAVCSPGGTTIAGVEALEAGAFRAAASAAVTAAFEKTKKL